MDWDDFVSQQFLLVTVQPSGSDSGCAIVGKDWVNTGLLDCGDIAGMRATLRHYPVKGNLSIDTPEKLEVVQAYVRKVGID